MNTIIFVGNVASVQDAREMAKVIEKEKAGEHNNNIRLRRSGSHNLKNGN